MAWRTKPEGIQSLGMLVVSGYTGRGSSSLVPRLSVGGAVKKTAWYRLLAHAFNLPAFR